MATVDELRNDIRETVGRHGRTESTAFTKEALAAICTAVGGDVDTDRRLPSKAAMRAGICGRLDQLTEDDPDRPFRKAELQVIAAALREE